MREKKKGTSKRNLKRYQ